MEYSCTSADNLKEVFIHKSFKKYIHGYVTTSNGDGSCLIEFEAGPLNTEGQPDSNKSKVLMSKRTNKNFALELLDTTIQKKMTEGYECYSPTSAKSQAQAYGCNSSKPFFLQKSMNRWWSIEVQRCDEGGYLCFTKVGKIDNFGSITGQEEKDHSKFHTNKNEAYDYMKRKALKKIEKGYKTWDKQNQGNDFSF